MKNSDRPLPLGLRVVVALVSAVLVFPLVLALVAIVHGAGIPVARWSAPLATILAGLIAFRARGRFAWTFFVVWLALVVYYATTFLRY